jgi:hypothetical protein
MILVWFQDSFPASKGMPSHRRPAQDAAVKYRNYHTRSPWPGGKSSAQLFDNEYITSTADDSEPFCDPGSRSPASGSGTAKERTADWGRGWEFIIKLSTRWRDENKRIVPGNIPIEMGGWAAPIRQSIDRMASMNSSLLSSLCSWSYPSALGGILEFSFE